MVTDNARDHEGFVSCLVIVGRRRASGELFCVVVALSAMPSSFSSSGSLGEDDSSNDLRSLPIKVQCSIFFEVQPRMPFTIVDDLRGSYGVGS